MSNFKKATETTGKSAQKLPESATALSEKELAQAAGGFNPQPDPPCVAAKPAQVNPIDFGIRVRPIGG